MGVPKHCQPHHRASTAHPACLTYTDNVLITGNRVAPAHPSRCLDAPLQAGDDPLGYGHTVSRWHIPHARASHHRPRERRRPRGVDDERRRRQARALWQLVIAFRHPSRCFRPFPLAGTTFASLRNTVHGPGTRPWKEHWNSLHFYPRPQSLRAAFLFTRRCASALFTFVVGCLERRGPPRRLPLLEGVNLSASDVDVWYHTQDFAPPSFP